MPEDHEDTATIPSDQPEAGQLDKAPEPDVLAAEDGPGAWTALAAPGKPDGEVDTRAR